MADNDSTGRRGKVGLRYACKALAGILVVLLDAIFNLVRRSFYILYLALVAQMIPMSF